MKNIISRSVSARLPATSGQYDEDRDIPRAMGEDSPSGKYISAVNPSEHGSGVDQRPTPEHQLERYSDYSVNTVFGSSVKLLPEQTDAVIF